MHLPTSACAVAEWLTEMVLLLPVALPPMKRFAQSCGQTGACMKQARPAQTRWPSLPSTAIVAKQTSARLIALQIGGQNGSQIAGDSGQYVLAQVPG